MADLYPVFEVPALAEEELAQEERYKKSVYFDFEKGDFLLSGDGKLKIANEQETYIQWCLKVAQTERYSCLAYSNDIGVEMVESLKQNKRAMQESMIARTLTEALMADPKGRTASVTNFSFEWTAPDALTVTFKVTGKNGSEETLSVSY